MRRILESLSMFVLIGVVILRPLVSESYDPAASPLSAALQSVADPSPLRTLVFDLLILLAALLALSARSLRADGPGNPGRRQDGFRGGRVRTGLEWGGVLILLAAIVSSTVAGNKRLAVNASVDWLCLALLAVTLANLMSRRWHRRLLLAAILGSACAQAAQCYEQRLSGFDETWAHYSAIKEDYWAQQGVELDSPRVELFERRLRAREASGFLEHSNITGSYFVLTALAALALTLAIRRWSTRAQDIVVISLAAALTLFLIGAMLLTGSRGAVVSTLAAITLWALGCLFRGRIGRRRTGMFVIGWLAVLGGTLVTVGYGLRHESLPGWSLTFRWHYWDAAASLIADHGLTGVGRENFGRHYVRYKSIESPEEVANPHNLFVHAAAEWGVLGLAGVVVMVIGASWQLTRREPPGPRIGASSDPAPANSPALVGWTIGLLAVVTLARLPLLGTADVNFLYYSGVTVGLFWLAGFMVALAALRPGSDPAPVSSSILTGGVSAALLGFVLHDMINFAAFVPPTATTAFAMLAFCLAERRPQTDPTKQAGRLPHWTPLVMVSVAILVVVGMGVIPVARSERLIARAHETGRNLAAGGISDQPADRYFRKAAAADPLDPTPHVEHARWLIALADVPQLRNEALERAADALNSAIERDPHNVGLRRMQMELFRRKAAFTKDPHDYLAAIEAARDALTLYPLDPQGFVNLAERQLDAAKAAGDRELLRHAVENYRQALDLDDARPLWAELRRFPPRKRAQIEQKSKEAFRLLHPPPAKGAQ